MMHLQAPDIRELKPRITVFGVGGAGGNAVNNMIDSGLQGCDFVCANTDAQALTSSHCERIIQMGLGVTQGLGAGSQPEIGRAAAEEVLDEIRDQLSGAHMAFITAGMGGGTGTGAAPVIARAARDMGILTVGVVTKPFQFEGMRRMRVADAGANELAQAVDTLIVIPNQNLFRIANEKTTFADAFAMADQVLYSGVACITDLMVKEGLINLDFADVRSIMRNMGKAMMGTGEATGERRANRAAEAAIANPLLDDVSMKGARGLLISITGGRDMTLFELDEAATRIREEVDQEANIILGATFDESLEGTIRVSVVATGIDHPGEAEEPATSAEQRIAEVAERLRAQARAQAAPTMPVAPRIETAAEAPRAIASTPSPRVPVAELPATMPVEDATFAEVTSSEVAWQDEPAPAMPEPTPPPFVQPATQDRTIRPARMPRVDELPVPAQREVQASRSGEVANPGPRKSLLERLASVGFGRSENASAEPARLAPAEPAPARSPGASDYARRPAGPARSVAQGQLDGQGRAAQTRPAGSEEDQLEIPAFLRRSSN